MQQETSWTAEVVLRGQGIIKGSSSLNNLQNQTLYYNEILNNPQRKYKPTKNQR